jgi:dihydroxyacetone kinase-like predicted kinase
MREEHNQKVIGQSEMQTAMAKEAQAKNGNPVSDAPRKKFGFITIVAGSGLADIFKGLGVDQVIEGGQTMNPSTEDILNAADKINAETIYVLPNNGNIILAANQAASIVEDKKIVVIPSKTVPQGISAMINFEETHSAKDNEEAMTEALSSVSTGQVTYAVRDTSIDGKAISNGDIMGIGDKGLLSVGKDIDDTVLDMLSQMIEENEDAELVSLYYGEEISEEQAEDLAGAIEDKFDDIDVEVQMGGQPVYYYLVSVE